jgi:alkaline phosphatase D
MNLKTFVNSVALTLCAFYSVTGQDKKSTKNQHVKESSTLPIVTETAVKVVAGPMPGYSEMRETAIWLQTNGSAAVQIQYWDVDNSVNRFTTEAIQTKASDFHAVTFVIGGLEPGKRYEYRVILNGKQQHPNAPLHFITQPLWKWRGDAPSFSLAFGSCAYINDSLYDRPGTPYGGEYSIFNSIASHKPEFMIWGGDNVYLREADWGSRWGIFNRYSHTRQCKELQNLLSTCHHYAIWDDHDYGPNDSDRGFTRKQLTRDAFKTFWPNPTYGQDNKGIYTSFCWGDAEFFLLDDRWFKSPNDRQMTASPEMLGEAQMQWLLDGLSSSNAVWKIIVVGSQFLNPVQSKESFMAAPAERMTIIDAIDREQIKGVIFLTGDRHFSELSARKQDGHALIYDLTCSPFTSGVASERFLNEENTFRVKDSKVAKRNFAILKFSGKNKARKLTISLYDSNNDHIWTKEINQTEWQ